MTARTTGGRPGSGRSPGSGGAPKRPTKRPAAGRPGAGTAKGNPAGLKVAEEPPADDVVDAPVDAPEAGEAEAAVETATPADDTAQEPTDATTDATTDETADKATDETTDADVVIDLTAIEDAPATSTDPAGVPPIDANVLLRAILTPPAGIANGEGITDALTGAVPTWRLDEEPIYLETIRDLGVPAVPEAEGGTGEVIVGEIVTQEA